MEIERKYLIENIEQIPFSLTDFKCKKIEQAYLTTEPVIRVRKDNDEYYLTYKSKGLLAREEYNLPLTSQSYATLQSRAEGNIITKNRYLIPIDNGLTIELDVFEGKFEGLILAEVEFESVEDAERFTPPHWFGKDVTLSGEYQNSRLSRI